MDPWPMPRHFPNSGRYLLLACGVTGATVDSTMDGSGPKKCCIFAYRGRNLGDGRWAHGMSTGAPRVYSKSLTAGGMRVEQLGQFMFVTDGSFAY
jgi:hypothetical protein